MELIDNNSQNIKRVIIIGNFGTQEKEVNSIILPNGEWYNIYANNTKVVTSDQNRINLAPGQFIILADNKTTIPDDESLLLASEDNFLENKIKIYPNPSKNKFYIESDNSLKLPLKLSVFNINGSLVMQRKIIDHSYYLEDSILPKGMYNFVLSNNEFTVSKKIIKN
tara:strand:- start:426 stop:926 length:501 start_codon:yes stop_codon:yes gene_type:complete